MSIEANNLLDLSPLVRNERGIGIALPMNKDQHLLRLLPAILLRQPPRALGQDAQAREEQDGGDHLQGPRKPKGRLATDEAAPVADEEHDGNAPRDGPLLHADEPAALRGGRQLRDVHRNLRRADAYGQAVDDPPDDEHGDVYGCGDDYAADDPAKALSVDRVVFLGIPA